MPVEPDLRRVREVAADLDEARAEVRIADVEVVDADTALLLEELKAHRPRLGRAVAGADDPLKLLAGHDRHDPEAALTLGTLQERADMVELAVIPTRPVGLLERQDRDPVGVGERPDVTTEAVADVAQQRRRRDRLPKMLGDEPNDLPADLQVRDIRVEIQPIDTLDLKRHMALEDVVDVRHARGARHRPSIHHEGRLRRPGAPSRHPGRPGGGPDPLPLLWGLICQGPSTGCPRLGRASGRSRRRRVRRVRDARSGSYTRVDCRRTVVRRESPLSKDRA